jgi:hypothetical protein
VRLSKALSLNMNVENEFKNMLVIWVVFGITALAVSTDLVILRSNPESVVVESAEIRQSGRGKVCELVLKSESGLAQRSVDKSVCRAAKKDTSLILNKTKMLERWISLKDTQGKNVSSGLLENRLITDVAFILLAAILPFLFWLNVSKSIKRMFEILLYFQIFGVIYFWFSWFI